MSNLVKWPCEIPKEGIFGVQFYYYEINRGKFEKPQRFCNVDRRLFIALAAAILAGKNRYDLKGINTYGIYCNRNIRGGKKKSTHAYGLGCDICGFQLEDGREWWVENDSHKELLQQTATEIMRPYFPDVITWDVGQWRGGFPHEFSPGTRRLHENHYHINPTPGKDFEASLNEWHIRAVERVIGKFGYPTIEGFQLARRLKDDGIAGVKTCEAIVTEIIERR